MALTELSIRKTNKLGKLADGLGLYLQVTPSGGKYWRYAYRFNGKQKTLALGTYPDIGLAKARERHREARTHLALGIDPGEHKKQSKVKTGNTFEEIATEWLNRQPLKDITRNKLALWIERDCAPLSTMTADTITARDVLAIARPIEPSSAERAHRLVAMCGQILRYAVATGNAERDPTGDLKGALSSPPKGNFPAITDPTHLAKLLQAIYAHSGHPLTIAALKLSALTFTRPGELRGALWAEMDTATQEWRIPAARMKMNRDHIVPLSTQAIEVINRLPRSSVYVLPMQADVERPMAANTVADAVRKMGFNHTAHGFRATARTILDEVLNQRVDLIEHQLAHAVKDANGRAYNRTAHLPARKVMMQTWADYLEKLRLDADTNAPASREQS
jgi:integrase